jgi:hypothetical protein
MLKVNKKTKMKKLMIIIAVMIAGVGNSQNLPKNLSREEKRFVNNVIEITNDVIVNITKRTDGIIVLEFWNTMYTLKDGYIDEVWILEDEDWLSLGRESDAY